MEHSYEENKQAWSETMSKETQAQLTEEEFADTMRRANDMLALVKTVQDVNQKLSAVFIELYQKPELKEVLDQLMSKHGLSINQE